MFANKALQSGYTAKHCRVSGFFVYLVVELKNIITMKKVILVLFAVLFAIPTFAESDTYKSISIHMSGGRKNADGTTKEILIHIGHVA